MRKIKEILLTLAALLSASAGVAGETPERDFSFTTREGRVTSLCAELDSVRPDARVILLLYDPDCGECREIEERLAADPTVAGGIADKTTVVIAVYPSDGIPEPDDLGFLAYLRSCGELPGEWTVGIDNGSLFETDACMWDNLPLLLEFRADEMKCTPSPDE